MSPAPDFRASRPSAARRPWAQAIVCVASAYLQLLLSGCGASTCANVQQAYSDALSQLTPNTDPAPIIVGVQLVLLEQVATSFLDAQARGLEQRLDDNYGAIDGLPARLDWRMAVSDVTLQGAGNELQACASLSVSATAAAAESGIGAWVRAGVSGDAELCTQLVAASDSAGVSLWQMRPGSLAVQRLRLEGTGIAGLASGTIDQLSGFLERAIPPLAAMITTTQPLFVWQGALLAESGPRLHPVAMTIEGHYLYLALATEPIDAEDFAWQLPEHSSPIVLQASDAAMAQLASAWLRTTAAETSPHERAYVVDDIQIAEGRLTTVVSVFDRSWPCTCVQLRVHTQASVTDQRLVIAPDQLELLSNSRPDLLVRGALPNHRELGHEWSEQLALWLAEHVIAFGENQRLVVVPRAATLMHGRLDLGADLHNQLDDNMNTTFTPGNP